MKYGIYDGEIVEIREDGNTFFIVAEGKELVAPRSKLKEIPDNISAALEPELLQSRIEVNALLVRMNKLDEAYFEKMEALRHLLTEARRKQIAIVSKALGGVSIGKKEEKVDTEAKGI